MKRIFREEIASKHLNKASNIHKIKVTVTNGYIYTTNPALMAKDADTDDFYPMDNEFVSDDILERLKRAVSKDIEDINLTSYAPMGVSNVRLADIRRTNDDLETTFVVTINDPEVVTKADILEFIEGQCSEGWGEDFGQRPFMAINGRDKLYFYPYNGYSRVR